MAILDNTFWGSTGSGAGGEDLEALLRRLQQIQTVEPSPDVTSILPGMDVVRPEAGEPSMMGSPAVSSSTGKLAGTDSKFPESGTGVPRNSQVFYPFKTTTEPTNPPTPPMERPGVKFDAPPDYAGGETGGQPAPQVSSQGPMRGPSGPVPGRTRVAQAQTGTTTDATPDFGPTLMDRLTAAAYGSSGHMWDYRTNGQGAQQSAYAALIENGVSPATAKAAVQNPMIMQQLATRLGTKGAGAWTEIGTDRFGNKRYGFVNPQTGAVTPYQPDVGQAPGTTPGGDTSLSGEEYLKTLDPSEARQVKGLAEGRIKPPPMGRKNPYWEQLIEKAGIYEPGFDMTKFNARQQTINDFSKGKAAANIKALNTVMGHLDSLDKAIEPMGNYTTAPGILNRAKDVYRNTVGDTDYQKARASFRLKKSAVASELMKVFRETGGSVTEVKDWENKIDENDSPAALRETIKSALELIGSRMSAVNDQWNRVMNKDRDMRELLSPTAREVFDRLSGEVPPADTPPPAAERPNINARGLPKRPAGTRLPNPNFDPKKPESPENPMYVISDGKD